MKTSCVAHPPCDVMLVLRRSHVDACDGNHCAAALLSFFEYWHNVKLDQQGQAEKANRIAEMHGDEPTQDTSLLQFHNTEELQAGILHLFGARTIQQTLPFLVEKGFISLHKNPNPRYHFDKTRYIMFHPDAVNACIDAAKMPDRSCKSAAPSGKSKAAIPEITPEILPPSSPTERMPPRARATRRCPVDYVPSPVLRLQCETQWPEVNVDEALEAMRDYEFRTGHTDWDATLRTWIRREARDLRRRGPPLRYAQQREMANYKGTLDFEEIINGTDGRENLWDASGSAGVDLQRGPERAKEARLLARPRGPAD